MKIKHTGLRGPAAGSVCCGHISQRCPDDVSSSPCPPPFSLHCRHDVGNLQRVIFVYSSGMMRRKSGCNERPKIHARVHVLSAVSVRMAASEEAGMRQAQGS